MGVTLESWKAASPRLSEGISAISVIEIESAIAQLPAKNVAELMAWLQEYHERVWDRQIENDLESGRLDPLLAEVEKEHQQGLARPL